MDARSIIAKLRRGQVPTGEELNWFAQGLADGGVSDAQAGAFAMAVCMGGLGAQGRADLTIAMRDSGDVLSWDFDGPVIDKHSTGGSGGQRFSGACSCIGRVGGIRTHDLGPWSGSHGGHTGQA